MNVRAAFAELVGVFGFVFIGVSSVVVAAMPNSTLGLFGVAVAHGLGIAVMASAVAPVSGGHLNPAVSIGAWMANKLSLVDTVGYLVGQVAGAVLAVATVGYAFGNAALSDVMFGTPEIAARLTTIQAVVVEGVLAMFLVLSVFGTCIDSKAPKTGALFVGLSVLMGVLAGGTLTGASMNPARYLGPAIYGGALGDWVVYVSGPILGAAVAVAIYLYIRRPDAGEQPAD